jgi:hypothetical protein
MKDLPRISSDTVREYGVQNIYYRRQIVIPYMGARYSGTVPASYKFTVLFSFDIKHFIPIRRQHNLFCCSQEFRIKLVPLRPQQVPQDMT